MDNHLNKTRTRLMRRLNLTELSMAAWKDLREQAAQPFYTKRFSGNSSFLVRFGSQVG